VELSIMHRILLIPAILLLAPHPAGAQSDGSSPPHVLIRTMTEELDYSMKNLALPDGTKPYFLAYTVTDIKSLAVRTELGAVTGTSDTHQRVLGVDLRIGDYKLDSSHQIRGGRGGFRGRRGGGGVLVSIDDNPAAIKHALWLATDSEFKAAVNRYHRVLTNLKTMVEEEDPSADFSREEAHVYSEPEAVLAIDRDAWVQRLRKVSRLAREYPLIHNSTVSLTCQVFNRFFVNSEGSRIQTGLKLLRVNVAAGTKADDGMALSQSFIFNAASADRLPSEEEITQAFKKVIEKVLALRKAPIVEPFIGPAILVNRASAVFFHEIFGHRIEGHRQKNVEEGQTFTKKIGKPILPEFLSVEDNPTVPRFGGEDLRGYYRFDDEGVPAQNAVLVNKGILAGFLMSRSPIRGFPRSNGHGRRAPGSRVVSRMGNTIILSSKAVSFSRLRELLVEQCRKQEKPFGLLFEDISGGFTGTGRGGGQIFKVLPIVVYRVFPDGRPDELVRGVDIVGTPLTCFSKIIHTGNDPAVFNGTCGAESGSVPVSAISPSILVSQMEIEKRSRAQDKPPILPPPIGEKDDVK